MAGVVGRQELPNEDAHAPRSRHGRPRSKKPAALLLSDLEQARGLAVLLDGFRSEVEADRALADSETRPERLLARQR
jgi:hypothetical protein